MIARDIREVPAGRMRRFWVLSAVSLAATLLAACAAPNVKPDPPGPFVAVAAPTPVPPPTYLVIRLKARRLDLMREDGDRITSFPIAVGRAGRETPTGRFAVEEMLEYPHYPRLDPKDRSRLLEMVPPGPANPLGERWIGFAHGEGWTLGIHGTPRPELLGQAVSGGCIRMRNADVIRVYDEVRLGTPVVVHP